MARKPEPPPRRSRVTVPARCHPAVKVVFAEMARQGVTYDELEYRSGVLKSTFKAWRMNNRPGLETMEAALGGLGWSFLPVPSLAQLPPPVRAKLEALAAEWSDLDGLLASVARGPLHEPSTPARARRPAAPAAPSPARVSKPKRFAHPDQSLFVFETSALEDHKAEFARTGSGPLE